MVWLDGGYVERSEADDTHSALFDEAVLEIVDVGDAAGANCAPFRIVRVARREAVVSVVVLPPRDTGASVEVICLRLPIRS